MSPCRGGTGIAKIAGAAPLMTVQLIAIKGAVPSKMVPPAKVGHPRGHHYSRCHPLAWDFLLLNEPTYEGLAKAETKGRH